MRKSITNAITVSFLLTFSSVALNAQTWGSSGNDATCVTGGNTRITVKEGGPVWVGDGTGTQKLTAVLLYVDGHLKAREIVVDMANWPDYVFSDNYELLPLDQVSEFIKQNGHLPGVPSAKSIEDNGLNVADAHAIMMQKIEEMQLYILQLNDRIKELEEKAKPEDEQQDDEEEEQTEIDIDLNAVEQRKTQVKETIE